MELRLRAGSIPNGLARWLRYPARGDPRLPFAALLALYLVLGTTLLGFNRSPAQILVTVAAAAGFDMLLHRLLRGALPPLFPLSAAITGMGLSILLNYAHGTVARDRRGVRRRWRRSTCVTFDGRHVINPALARRGRGARARPGLGEPGRPPTSGAGRPRSRRSSSPARSRSSCSASSARWLVGAFLVFYALQLALRAYATRWHVPPETIFFGALTAPAFYLFAFFMITDPATSPPAAARPGARRRWRSCSSTWRCTSTSRSTRCSSPRSPSAPRGGVVAARAPRARRRLRAARAPRRLVAARRGGRGARRPVAALGLPAGLGHRLVAGSDGAAGLRASSASTSRTPGSARARGRAARRGRPGDRARREVAPVGRRRGRGGGRGRRRPAGPLLHASAEGRRRTARCLYRNLRRLPVRALPDPRARRPHARCARPRPAVGRASSSTGTTTATRTSSSSPASAQLVFLENRLVPDGRARLHRRHRTRRARPLRDQRGGDGARLRPRRPARPRRRACVLAHPAGLRDADALQPRSRCRRRRIAGDRRRFDFMHRTWHDANNGGGHRALPQLGRRVRPPAAALRLGADERRWTMAIGAADLDGDGWPDLYVANDFGPDRLLINRRDGAFAAAAGARPGRDRPRHLQRHERVDRRRRQRRPARTSTFPTCTTACRPRAACCG